MEEKKGVDNLSGSLFFLSLFHHGKQKKVSIILWGLVHRWVGVDHVVGLGRDQSLVLMGNISEPNETKKSRSILLLDIYIYIDGAVCVILDVYSYVV